MQLKITNYELQIKKVSIILVLITSLLFGCDKHYNKQPRWIGDFFPAVPALDYLPLTIKGYTDWVKALDQGIITPRDSIDPSVKPSKPLDLDIMFEGTKGGLFAVIFPHRPHTMWLSCDNCHPEIFKKKIGANPINMTKIIRGEYCGRCHGKVAFPLNDCLRCHSGPIIEPN